MIKELQSYKTYNTEKSANIVSKLLDGTFLKDDYLKESIQEQLEMHLIVANELSAMANKEETELKELIARKTARITVIRETINRLSDSSMSLGKIRDALNDDNIEDTSK
jgi:hypothetical protein